MDIKPIKTETDYQAALKEIESLMDADLDSPEGERLDLITTLVEAYESKHYPRQWGQFQVSGLIRCIHKHTPG